MAADETKTARNQETIHGEISRSAKDEQHTGKGSKKKTHGAQVPTTT
jgi:hypothetical protein